MGFVAILTGTTSQIIILSVLGAVIMYGISMLSLIVLRKKEPNLERPFKAPFYPLFPIIAFVLSMVCMVSIVYYNQNLGMIFFGGMLICLGGYYLKNKANARHK